MNAKATTAPTAAPTTAPKAPKRLRRNAAWESLHTMLSPVLGTDKVAEKIDSQAAIEAAIEKFKATAPLTAQVEAFRDAVYHAFQVGAITADLQDGETLKAAAQRLNETESPEGTNGNTVLLKVEEVAEQAAATDASNAEVKPAESTKQE